WFSSCLWPFATLGWPQETDELEYFFPTDVLITAHDIIFFWVARMIMMALHFKKDVPFKEVFFNPLVNDSTGQKMSKSKGNVVDPMVIIDKNGTDVLRFTLTSLTTPGRNLLLGDEKIEGIRNFANKIWNGSKFVIASIKDLVENTGDDFWAGSPEDMKLNIWDRWILSRLNTAAAELEKNIEGFNYSQASRILYNFFWSEFCDWYLESSKTRLYDPPDKGDKRTCQFILWYVLENYLRLLHPFMPHITERIWQAVPHKGNSIMTASFPGVVNSLIDSEVEKRIIPVFEVISEVRKVRSELKINPGKKVSVCLSVPEPEALKEITENLGYIYNLAGVSKIEFRSAENDRGYIKATTGSIDIFIYILDAVDMDLEIKRIEDELKKVGTGMEKSRKKLENPNFTKKAPEEIISKERGRLEQAMQASKVLREQFEKMKNIKK
ncbi:MAG TPA: valine--tRNA ligase, partial [Actinobacteria bacterium]|nr:valine--tRNA ligase [Actinomycetota bacterium]